MIVSSTEDQHSDTPSPVTIVGAGNWLIALDKIGPRVLEMCRGRYGSEVELFNSGSGGLALLDCLKGQELMLIVDAATFGGGAGEIRIVLFDEYDSGTQGVSVHQIGPLETLTIARHLYPEQMPKSVRMILVETDDLPEDEIDAVCKHVLDVLDREIEQWRSETMN